ncbi:hypothetical protein QJS10_CPA16g01071 [Acorus calamus]|uniref:Cysteine-rich transmembrane domain-containing protein n=1 Tax=Acorus calamus TaxID=4465 RepID=A0AAV9D5C1_ACOCL|nr:hypothetical protein QJS10_CPA16g01071 [Acorus calamus]
MPKSQPQRRDNMEDKSQPQRRDNMEDLPPPGYPTGSSPAKKPCCPRTKKKGEGGFIEGCFAALCCCWLCETFC